MILRFGFRNFLSFDEGVECSFESDSKNKVNTLLNIRGANGSGKTNLLKALAFFMDFVANSFSDLKPDDSIGVIPFFESSAPTDFFVEFFVAGFSYIYELSLTKDGVIRESLSRKNKRYIPVFTRDHDVIKCISEFAELKKLKCRNNASIISIAHQNEVDCLKTIYSVFYLCITNITTKRSAITLFFDCAEEYGKPTLSKISKIYNEDKKLFEKVKKFIVESDIGICDIKLKSEQLVDGSTIFVPSFCHKVGDKTYFLPYSAESRGTQFLYTNLNFFLFIIDRPHTLLIFDELDMGLHPLLVRKIVSLYSKQDIRNCGQVIFTAHDTTILDDLKPDKVFLLNKENNESYGYLVSECSSAIVRKDRNIRTPYEQGRIGGVPKL